MLKEHSNPQGVCSCGIDHRAFGKHLREHLHLDLWFPENCRWCWEDVQLAQHLPFDDLRKAAR